MIRFEQDDRTRGEQLVLGAIPQGQPLASDWTLLRPEDFSHDLHGRIFRHMMRLLAQHLRPDPGAVVASRRSERRGRGRVLDGVPDYLEWLTKASWTIPGPRVRWLVAFLDAMLEQHAAREATQRGRE
ncbi:DnaB-like helicase N-terminal domain-containing protein [Paraburkholderia strydomiana]|uniref:DnaB-like helicase N-terminal domain-containing protein n=1 Tax=Paraburkholderia strydomiana TaxID=1245417 RepID=UPI001BEC5BED|nr:DnaB-like helicase N-terminal domain-containing protein [Paraburkholderia strydomiana]MBT2789173.1 hypothetical protein [Paraburkholderia strydomiana]